MFRLLLLFFCLLACDNQGDDHSRHSESEIRGRVGQEGQVVQIKAPPAPEETRAAEAMTAFANRASQYLENGFYSLADRFYVNTLNYQKNFRLPARPATGQRQRDILIPPGGIFDEQEESDLAEGLQKMDRALDKLLGHYASLEKYVADKTIRDDGKLGDELVEKIGASHADFIKARHSWLAIVQKRAREAQHVLLYEHPLERQILAGENIFAQIREASEILGSDSQNPQLLKPIYEAINAEIANAARPPFMERPALERLYRAFLDAASIYSSTLERGLDEGLHGFQKQEIGNAGRACANAWNEFAMAANAVGDRGSH